MQSPRLYATLLLWLLSELFERLPEVGDPEKPVLVFFFDEAHLLFDDAPKALVDKVEQVARLIRSKGVGVYFISQNPDDVRAGRARPARQSGPARAARLHAARPEGAEGRRRDLPREPRLRHPGGDHRARHRRGAGLAARRQGRADGGRAHADPPALLAPRPLRSADPRPGDRPVAGRRASTTRPSTARAPTRCWPPAPPPRSRAIRRSTRASSAPPAAMAAATAASGGAERARAPPHPPGRRQPVGGGGQVRHALGRLAARPHGRPLAAQGPVPVERFSSDGGACMARARVCTRAQSSNPLNSLMMRNFINQIERLGGCLLQAFMSILRSDELARSAPRHAHGTPQGSGEILPAK